MREQSARDRLLQIIEDGYIDPGYVIMAFVKWNTNEDIKEMCHANEIELWLNDDEEDDDDADDEDVDDEDIDDTDDDDV